MGRKLVWQLFPSYILITLGAVWGVTWYSSNVLRHFFYDKVGNDLEAAAWLVERHLREEFSDQTGDTLQPLCSELARKGSMRLTVVSKYGEVLCDSEEDPQDMENHANRPEIMESMQSRVGLSTRFSTTLRDRMMYVAVPLREGDDVVAAVRTSRSTRAIDQAVGSVQRRILVFTSLMAFVAVGVSYLASRRIAKPLENMRKGAERFAKGDLKHKLTVPETEELAALARALNSMSNQLDERIHKILSQQMEREAVLSSMVEAVIAVDTDERVLSCNRAAIDLFGVPQGEQRGRSLQELFRNSQLHSFVKRTLEGEIRLEGEIVLREKERFLQSHGSVLRDSQGKKLGALIVLNDVTPLRRLEEMRRTFVANVSHELRTPITAIKGFAESLLDGALDQKHDAKRFVKIISDHTERLNALVEDLLSLSKIERSTELAEIEMSPRLVAPLVFAAVEYHRSRAEDKRIRIDVDCEEGLTAQINDRLLEQAISNLIDNAIKYSPEETEISVKTVQNEEEVAISVQDQGPGIPREHLGRLFERFYRADKARSRELGGTGLGLSIVKHIIQAHGGSVDVQSAPGEGSTFTLRLPPH